MATNDDRAAEFYENPDNLTPAGPGRQREDQAPRLSAHFPVRFAPEVIAKVRYFADRDAVTVGAWIRRAVERELDRRMPPDHQTSPAPDIPVSWRGLPQSTETTDESGSTFDLEYA